MGSGELAAEAAACAAAWEAAIAELGVAWLERPGACGHWRVRDVIAHFNGWDRWQLVQLRSAFTGESPAPSELTGGLELAEPDPALPMVEGLNVVFEAANRDRPLGDVLAEWRELNAMRAAWVDAATPDQLDAVVGADWHGAPGRFMRLQSEVPHVRNPRTAAAFVHDQLDHPKAHLAEIRFPCI